MIACRFSRGVCEVCGATASRDDVIRSCGGADDPAAALRQPPQPCGPGCQLKKILDWFRFSDEDCGCSSFAATMDAWGPSVCRRRLDIDIMPHLKAQAAKRNLGFAAPLVRPLVLRAIRRAELETAVAGS